MPMATAELNSISLDSLASRFRGCISLTLALVLFESIAGVLFPASIGIVTDSLLRGSLEGFAAPR